MFSQTIRSVFSPKNCIQCAVALVILFALYLVSLRNYLLFHGIIELASIAIAFSIFIIVWNTRRTITNTFFLVIGISFLFTGGIDLFHMLAYKGMGVFAGNSSDIPTQLWIAARYFQSIAFLAATLLIGKSLTQDRKYDAEIIFAACAVATGFLLASIVIWQNFPHCYIDGTGLTPFKIVSEYIISIILVAGICILFSRRRAFDPTVWGFLVVALAFLIAGELAFTSYVSVYGFMNMLGHLFKLVAFYFFYRAIVVVGITRPVNLLFFELKEKEEALQKSESRYSITFEAVNDGLWDWHVPSGNAFFSPHYYTMLGYSDGEFPATYSSWRTLVHPDELESVEEQLQQHVKSDTGFEIELRMKTKSGGWKWVSTRGMVVERNDAGTAIRMVGTLSDISGRKRAEEARRESDARFTELFDTVSSGVAIYEVRNDGQSGKDYIIKDFNKTALAIEGKNKEDVVGKSLLDLRPAVDDYGLIPIFREVWKTGNPAYYPATVYIDDKYTNYYENRVFRLPGDEIVAVYNDVTEQKQAEEKINFANSFLSTQAESTIDGILVVDGTGKIISYNRRFIEIWGVPPSIIASASDKLALQSVLDKLVNPGEFLSKVEYLYTHREEQSRDEIALLDGRILDRYTAPMLGADREYYGRIWNFRDITTRKRTEEALALTNRKLLILSSITRHDINNQLMAVNGFLGLLQKKVPDPDLADFFNRITRASDRISSMIRFTKEYEQIGVSAPTWQDCHTLVETAASEAPLGKVIVKNDIPAGTEVFADPLAVKVFYNLMDNAARHGGKITTIRFSAEEREGTRIIVCEDDGGGVAVDEKEKIFKRGFGKNTGLGLFLTREILDITGITIHEAGEPGKGARFEMTVPDGAWRVRPGF